MALDSPQIPIVVPREEPIPPVREPEPMPEPVREPARREREKVPA